jgi:hypothetical protein
LRAHRREPTLEILDGCITNGAAAERAQGDEVAPICIERSRRAPRGEKQQVPLEIWVDRRVGGDGHGASMDSVGERRLLSAATLTRLSPRVAVPMAGLVVALVAAAVPAPAQASQLIARDTSSERLVVSRSGKVLVSYRARGRLHRVLAWGAVNAREPSEARRQIGFALDYSGGSGKFGRPVWRTLRNACGPYRGPALPWLVTACTAPDGSHWALQSWRRSQANFGLPPWKPGHGARELRLSHWRGPVARLDVWLDWSYGGRWHHLFGRLTYRGRPVHGYSTTPNGQPLDGYGRVLYLDTFDSAYGRGWRRENGFVARRPDGSFCYGFVPHRASSGEARPAGHGTRYRLAASGPGVTPDIAWEGSGLHDFRSSDPGDRAHEASMNELQRKLAFRSTPCHA